MPDGGGRGLPEHALDGRRRGMTEHGGGRRGMPGDEALGLTEQGELGLTEQGELGLTEQGELGLTGQGELGLTGHGEWAEPTPGGSAERQRLESDFLLAMRQAGSIMQLLGQVSAERIGINVTDLNC